MHQLLLVAALLFSPPQPACDPTATPTRPPPPRQDPSPTPTSPPPEFLPPTGDMWDALPGEWTAEHDIIVFLGVMIGLMFLAMFVIALRK